MGIRQTHLFILSEDTALNFIKLEFILTRFIALEPLAWLVVWNLFPKTLSFIIIHLPKEIYKGVRIGFISGKIDRITTKSS